MEASQITKKVVDFQKLSFDHWFNTMALIQDQTESTMDVMLDNAGWIPKDGRKAIRSWVSLCQQERGRFKSYMDEGFSTFQKVCMEAVKPVEKAKKMAASGQNP